MKYSVKSSSSKVWILVLVLVAVVIGVFAALKAFGSSQNVNTNNEISAPAVTVAPVVTAAPTAVVTAEPVVTAAPVVTIETDADASLEVVTTEDAIVNNTKVQMSVENFLAFAQENAMDNLSINLFQEVYGEFYSVELIDFDTRKNDKVMAARTGNKFLVYVSNEEIVTKDAYGKKGKTNWAYGYLVNTQYTKASTSGSGRSDETLITVAVYLDSDRVQSGYWYENGQVVYGVRLVSTAHNNGGNTSSQPTKAPSQPTEAPSQPTVTPEATFTIPTVAPATPEATFTIPNTGSETDNGSTDFTIGNGNQNTESENTTGFTIGNSNHNVETENATDFTVGGNDSGSDAGFTIGQ